MEKTIEKIKIDKIDRKILFTLDQDSRMPISRLAKKLRISTDLANYRIKRLEKTGIIKGYITIIDPSKFGFIILRPYLKFQNTTKEIEQEMISYLSSHPANLTTYRTDGKFDLAMGFLVKDLIDFKKIYFEFQEKYCNYVGDSELSIMLNYVHMDRKYLLGEKTKKRSRRINTCSAKEVSVDYNDLKLLKEISKNARTSLLEIAKKLNLTAAGVKYKLQRLEQEKIIVAYKLHIDSNKLGYQYFKVDLTLNDVSIIPSLTEFITTHPNVIYQDITIGGSDFEFDCELKSQEDLYQLIDEIKKLFPEKIRDFFYYKAITIYNYAYFPKTLLTKNNQINNNLNKIKGTKQ